MAPTNVALYDHSTAKREIAYHAACELEALLVMLRREQGNSESELVLRSTLLRLTDLSGVLLAVLGADDDRSADELAVVVYGKDAVEEAEHA